VDASSKTFTKDEPFDVLSDVQQTFIHPPMSHIELKNEGVRILFVFLATTRTIYGDVDGRTEKDIQKKQAVYF
jgi:hypothetical protein